MELQYYVCYHAGYPVQPHSTFGPSTTPCTSRSSEERVTQELQDFCIHQSQSSIPAEMEIPADDNSPHDSPPSTTEVRGKKTPTVTPVEIHIHHDTSPAPISTSSTPHSTTKSYSLSISQRPRLSTPHSFTKGGTNIGITPASATPVAHVRSSQQWYDHIRMILHPLTNYRYSSRSIEETSGHYVNDGLGPPTVHIKDSPS